MQSATNGLQSVYIVACNMYFKLVSSISIFFSKHLSYSGATNVTVTSYVFFFC